MNMHKDSRGFIKYIIIIVIAIIILSYFGFNLRGIVESDTSKGNFSYVWNGVVHIWKTYLAGPVLYVWNNVVVDIVWNMILKPSLDYWKK